jgi:hypothetical protein
MTWPTETQQRGLLILVAALVALAFFRILTHV